jgi:stage III sporulation protein SpoIIIAA
MEKDVMHTLYAHELHKLNERQALREAEQARLINRVVRARRRAGARRTRPPVRTS